MKPPVPLERARAMIQDWYNQYCRAYEKPVIQLAITEEDEKVSGAYKLMNPENSSSTVIFWSTVADCERSESGGIPGDLLGSIRDAFNELG
ncbi:MAG: hypothetical protein PVH82_08270 [Desulfobacteraceae bacterium]|jgi:hypothetical protein